MRALFLLAILLILAAATWLVVAHADDIYCRMLLNKAVYQHTSENHEAAIAQALAVLQRRPDYTPALERAVEWLTERNAFRRALDLAADIPSTSALSAATRYQLGISAYELGREDDAGRFFRSVSTTATQIGKFPEPLVESYLALAAGDSEASLLALERANSHFEGQMFYHSLLGRNSYARDDIVRATAELGRALALGDRNPRVRLILAVCLAIQGDESGMERYLDALTAEGLDAYAEASREIGAWRERLGAIERFTSPEQWKRHRDRMIHLRLASAGIDLRQSRFDDAEAKLQALLEDYPERAGLYTRMGLLQERRRASTEALAAYRHESNRLLLAGYKTALLDDLATTTIDQDTLRRFLPAGSKIIDSDRMERSVGVPTVRGWNLYAAGSFSTTFTVEATGRHAVGLLGRGQAAAEIWPIVEVEIDDGTVSELYINNSVQDYFETHTTLLAGEHHLRISYLNNAVPEDESGDRNFILEKVFIQPEPN